MKKREPNPQYFNTFCRLFHELNDWFTSNTHPRDGKIANFSFPDIFIENYLRFIPNSGFLAHNPDHLMTAIDDKTKLSMEGLVIS